MRKIILTLLIVIAFTQVKAQSNYAADLISPSLRNRANATIRNSETIVDMRAADNVILTLKTAITIWNKNGDGYAQLNLFYNKNISIKSVKGEIYNEFGKLTGKFSLSDFSDESAVSNFSLFEDNRIKHYAPTVNTYPYTIAYQYEIRNKQNLIIPDWIPLPGFDIAVEKSSYKFICNAKEELRIKANNYTTKPEETENEKFKSLYWQVENLAAIKYEPYSPPRDTYLTSVKIAPKNFVYYNFKGSYSNWQELGKLSYEYLLKGRSVLPTSTQQLIKDLVREEMTDKAKAKKIYEYLQQKTRYISVQVGIGGFQPFSAEEVDRLGYGDCKALVNYMQSLLKVVDIESYYCVVQAGNEKKSLMPDFASMEQGNHIILCLPLKGDTTWLECTNQEIPFGFLGDFTDDRLVLACTEAGGKLLRTPKLNTQGNLQMRHADLQLLKNGTLTGEITTRFSGAQYDNRTHLLTKPRVEQEKSLNATYGLNNLNFEKIEFDQDKEINPMLTEKLKISVDQYASLNHDKLFLNLNLLNIQRTVPAVRNRLLPMCINRGFTDIDSLTYRLDPEILPLVVPQKYKINNQFGTYEMEAKIINGSLAYYLRLVLNEGTFKADSYNEFYDFINEVSNKDHLKLVLSLKK
ncbi:DUF3857 domain-containing transglutaminase family protein [Pedobacter sp. ASV28]|uniref:DUF3857 domain-containing protein n=1 Tax=Pedobacter sp. ASV28 TaxID=2795123 RepID=UPI0018EDE183|nr:DUF3857 domain-containing transglutaminase family protein [Pedobacter sp. ASV28]